MSITLTRTWTRPDTSVEFFPISNTNPVISQTNARATAFQGTVTRTSSESADQKTLTITQNFNNITDVGNFVSYAPDPLATYLASYAYCSSTGQHGSTTLSGISNAFTITSTYTFASGADVTFLVSAITSQSTNLVGTVTQTPTSVSVVHSYANSDAWNSWNWREFNIAPLFGNVAMTKTETWALV
jgi:hypothetical protein